MLRARRLVMALSALALAAGTGAATAGPVQADVGASAGAGAGAGADADARQLGFADCPTLSELPEGADPAKWRCEAMTATGHLTLGRVEVPIDRPLAITFAEGRVDGEFRQVFGAMAATPYEFGAHRCRSRLGTAAIRTSSPTTSGGASWI